MVYEPSGNETPSIAYQGEAGANSEIAVHHFFKYAKPVPYREFPDVFEAVYRGTCLYGALPVENSLTGSIHQNFELLVQYPSIKIVAECKIRIVHNLIGLPGTTIDKVKRVFSHPQGLEQCKNFLNNHTNCQQVPFYDTAGAVAHLAREGVAGDVAIANEIAAQTHRMQILQREIEDNPQNYTRFLLITNADRPQTKPATKASLVFSLQNHPGALSECLTVFATYNLNMTKIESRPIPGRPWEYRFFVDLDIEPANQALSDAETEIRKHTTNYRVLGIYST